MILRLQANSPAEKAGLRQAQREVLVGNTRVPVGGDVILSVGGRAVNSSEDLGAAIDRYKPGDTVVVRVLRDGRQLDVNVLLDEAPRQTR
jgi:S1-C subfamily serine protease